jgi:hypothetical protein
MVSMEAISSVIIDVRIDIYKEALMSVLSSLCANLMFWPGENQLFTVHFNSPVVSVKLHCLANRRQKENEENCLKPSVPLILMTLDKKITLTETVSSW